MGSYRILGRIGCGGMAEVFLGRVLGAAGFEKEVAIKSILPAYTKDAHMTALLVEEARLASLLTHANIAQVLDFGQLEDRYFIVMEYVDGANLEEILINAAGRGVRLPLRLACLICRRVLNGLAFVHARCDRSGRPLDLIHRDVSPPNILISRSGEVKLTDFGIAKAANRAIVTEAGMIRGKVAYMSPEQAVGDKLDQRSDLFSLGVVLHEMLTGGRLFDGDDQVQVLRKVRDARIDPPSAGAHNVPPEIDSLVMRALERERDKRFACARDFDKALETAVRELDLDASDTDLQEWLRPIISERRVDPLPASGDLITFGVPSVPAAEGTQKISPDATTAKEKPATRHAWLGLGAVIVGLLVYLLWFLWPGVTTAPPPGPDGTKTMASPAIIAPDAGLKLADTEDAGSGAIADAGTAAAEHGGDRQAIVVKKSMGTLFINSEPWAKIYIDGRDTGVTTPTVDGIRLPSGRHRVRLENPGLELSLTFSLRIAKNQKIKRFVNLRREGVQH
ncbi:MAG TPA: serine/threonine-protein kinase [Myxococcota bacterium]|nr:serine/threonine-protein kinase [Myxococcota bacterium]